MNHAADAADIALPKKQKPRRTAAFVYLEFGAGDGIRTHDPNLGKVVLYP